MKIVSDAGPLMALAKVDGLAVLFHLFPRILIPLAVYEETVIAGQRLGAPDAALVATGCNEQKLVLAEAIDLVTALSQRSDVWISPALCHQVIELLGRSSQ